MNIPPFTPRPLSRLLLCLSLGLSLPLQAETHWQLPTEPLGQSLTRFAAQAGIVLSFDSQLTRGLHSAGLDGDYGVEQALARLLSGSGLVAVAQPDGSYRLETAASSLDLGAIDITGQHNPAFDSYRTPGPVYQVSREQLDRVPYSRPGDIFDSVPGVAAASSSNGAGLQLNIRGLQGMGRVKTLIDGSMQNVSTYKGYPGNREDTYVDPDLIASIDIKKGPDAGPQGAGVVGGIVNMRTINASDIITDPDKNWGLRIKGMYGNNVAKGNMSLTKTGATSITTKRVQDPVTGQIIRVKVENRSDEVFTVDRDGKHYQKIIRDLENGQVINETFAYRNANLGGSIAEHNQAGSIAAAWRPLENWEITAAHAVRQSGNYHSGSKGKNSWKGVQSKLADTEVYNTSINSDTWLLKSKITFLDDHSLELGHIKYRNQSGYFSSIGNFGHDGSWQDPLSEAESTTYTANYAWRPDNPWFDLHASLWKSRLTAEMTFSDIYFYEFANSVILDRDNLPMVTTDTLGSELWNNNTVKLPLGELSLKYGLSWSREKASGSNTTYYNMADGRRDTLGAFTQNQWQITPWLSLNAGLQHSRISMDSEQNERTFNILDPNYGFVLQPHESVQFYAQWSKGSRAPTIREAFITNGIVANPNLKTEKADNFEYGVNLLFSSLLVSDDQLGVKFSRFKNEYDDYIVRFTRAASGLVYRDNLSPYSFTNIDKAVYEGYEIAADYDAGWAFGRFTLTHFDKVKYCYPGFTGTGTQSDPYVVTPSVCHSRPNANDWGGNYVPPRQEKTAGLGVRLFDRKLILGANMKMSTESLYGGALRGVYNDAVTVWDNYEIYDLYGSFKATRNLEIGFSVENITDRFYIPSYSSSFEALPAPGRTARGTVTLTF